MTLPQLSFFYGLLFLYNLKDLGLIHFRHVVLIQVDHRFIVLLWKNLKPCSFTDEVTLDSAVSFVDEMGPERESHVEVSKNMAKWSRALSENKVLFFVDAEADVYNSLLHEKDLSELLILIVLNDVTFYLDWLKITH